MYRTFVLNLMSTKNNMAVKTIAYKPDFSLTPRVDQVGIEERAARFTKRSIKKETKMNGLLLTLNMIDLTTLEGKDSEGKVKQMCYKAKHLYDAYEGLPTVAITEGAMVAPGIKTDIKRLAMSG